MKIGILGKKIGMTQIFTEDGDFVPVTVMETGPCKILKIQGKEAAPEMKALLGFMDKKKKNITKPEEGFYKKIGVTPKVFIKEVVFDAEDVSVGGDVTVDIFKEKDFVDVTGSSIGKGFQGGVKRWHWRGGPSGHGSMHHRRVGSIGGSSFPSKVNKGQRLPGRMGNKTKTVQNLEVVKIYKDKNLMFVKGAVPGAKNGFLEIRMAKKKPVIRPKDEGKKHEETDKAKK